MGGRRGLRDDGEIAAGQVAKVEKGDGYFAVMRSEDGYAGLKRALLQREE